MAAKFHTLLLYLLLFISVSCSQTCPQNIEVFYPNPTVIPSPSPTPNPEPVSSVPSSSSSNPLPLPGIIPDSQPRPSSSNNANKTIAKAVAATAASTLVIAAIFFVLVRKYAIPQRRRDRVGDSFQGDRPMVYPSVNEFAKVDANIKGLVVDENGLDVFYWRQLEDDGGGGQDNKNMFIKGSRNNKMVEPVQEIPLLRGKSSTSQIPPMDDDYSSSSSLSRYTAVQSKVTPPVSMPLPLPVQNNNTPPPHPPPPAPPRRSPAPPPPPPPVRAKSPAPPPPPPPPEAGSSKISLRPPRDESSKAKTGEPMEDGDTGNGNNQVKLKPLHWDKVNKNVEHSMVWDKINGGSFRFDDDLMEALFGYVATNKKSPAHSNDSKVTASNNTNSSSQIMVLDARKSQNIAIVLKSLALSRRELIEALNEGQGLDADTVEKLMRIAPTGEEQSQILHFDGDPTKLADAESFLFDVLKTIPSAFTRLNAMQFRSNFDMEILHMKESLQALELGCKELRSQRLFMKLLEAILKAGNRMNAGTARGNAQAFNLTSLLKLSDVKSTDGKTTLLHFVVEEVVRSEGRKCYISRSRSLSRNNSSSSSSGLEQSTLKEDREKEYVMLGLPVVGGLSAEFTNVKKAASIDFNTFSGTCSALTARIAEVKELVVRCLADGKGGFVREMKGFIDDAEEELKGIRDEQERAMDLVRKTTQYYQAGASKDPFQIFVIVRDFLGMVDQVCIQISRSQQKRKSPRSSYESQLPNSQESRTKMKFPVLPPNFMAGKSTSNSSSSDVDS